MVWEETLIIALIISQRHRLGSAKQKLSVTLQQMLKMFLLASDKHAVNKE